MVGNSSVMVVRMSIGAVEEIEAVNPKVISREEL